MITENLKNSIRNELKEFLKREPTENEIMNSQNDHVIMGKVKERTDAEQIYFLEEIVAELMERIEKIEGKVEVMNNNTKDKKVLK